MCKLSWYWEFGLAAGALTPDRQSDPWIVDVDGPLIVVLDGTYYADTLQNAIDELRAILASANSDNSELLRGGVATSRYEFLQLWGWNPQTSRTAREIRRLDRVDTK